MGVTRVSDLLDRAFEGNRPVSAVLELTYKCNLLCSFCYNAPQDREELTGDQWLAALDQLKRAGTFKVTLSGGEPFLHRDFWKIAEGVRQREMVLDTFTNGVYLADREKAERFAGLAPFGTEISIHGADAATHDRITGISGSFDKLLIALRHLSELGLRVILKTPITRLNQRQLRAIEDLGDGFGFPVTFDTNLLPTDDGDLSPQALAADKAAMIEYLLDRHRRKRDLPGRRPVELMKQNCGTGRTTLAIDPYGFIFPCVAWRRPLANIQEVADLDALWRGRNGEILPDLAFVRKVADEVHRTTLVGEETGAFAAFCPAAAEKETGNPFTFYKAARISGEVRLEVTRKLELEGEGTNRPAE